LAPPQPARAAQHATRRKTGLVSGGTVTVAPVIYREGSMPKSPLRIIISLLLLVLFGGAIWFAMRDQSGKVKAEQALAETITLEGLISLDVETYLKDPRVLKILADNKIQINVTRIGSREMAAAVKPGMKTDFFFPSGVVAASQIADAAKKAGVTTAGYNPFYTPMVVASWAPVAKVLVNNGIAKPLNPADPKVFGLNLQKLTELMLAKKRWKDLPGNEAYDVGRSLLVSTTDVRKSNSAAMYLALTSYAVNGGELVTDQDTARKIAGKVVELFKRQGYQENYVNGNFDDYVSIGMGKTPLAFIYENQMVSYAISKKGIAPDMVLMYPVPTIFNKVVFVTANEKSKVLGELLSNNRELQKIAVEYGFRSSDVSLFSGEVKKTGLAISDRITDVIDPPSYEVMAAMIDVITQEMKQ
jgi:hypothetical protein